MNVQDLIDKLEQVEDKTQIMIMSVDGNYYDPIDTVETGFRYNHEWKEVGKIELTKIEKKQGYTDEDLMNDDEGDECVILYS